MSRSSTVSGGSGRRKLVAILVMAFAGTACTIQGPRVVLQGQGGAAAAPGTQVLGNKIGGQGSTFGGTSIGGGTVGGGATDAKACAGKSPDVGVTPTQIKLGSTFAISGPVSNISGPILKGVQSYINQVNAQGGIFGRQLFLKYYDDGWDAQRGKAKIKQLIEQDKVFMMVSVPSSNGLDAAQAYLDAKKVPVIGTSGLIESQFKANMQWPIGTSTRSASRIGLLDISKRLHAKNFAMIWLDLLAGFEAQDAVKKSIAEGFAGFNSKSLVAERRISLSEPSFESVWNDIANQARKNGVSDGRPDYVILAIDPTNAVKALQAAERLGFAPKIGWGGGAPLFLDLVPKNAPYAIKTNLTAGTSFFPPLAEFASNPAVQEYKSVVQKYYGSVDLNNPYLEGGYAGAALAVNILKAAGPCPTRKAVIAAANAVSNFSAANLTQALTFRPLGTSPQHYGNTYGIVVKVVASGKEGCTSQAGFCWVWVKAPTANGWWQDPTPGK